VALTQREESRKFKSTCGNLDNFINMYKKWREHVSDDGGGGKREKGERNAYNTNLKVNRVAFTVLSVDAFRGYPPTPYSLFPPFFVGVYANSRPASCVLGQRQKQIRIRVLYTHVVYTYIVICIYIYIYIYS